MENPARIGIITNLTKPDAVSRTREVVQRLRQAEAEVYLEEATAAACHEPGGLPLPELADAVEVRHLMLNLQNLLSGIDH